MKCIRAFSCSCLNDTMAAFRCVSTGWCCKILCFQCWSRRFPENTTAKPTTICLQRWYSQRAGKKDLPKYNYIYIHSKRERYIYMYQLNMTCLIKSKPMPWDTYLSNYIDLSVVVPLHLYSFIFLLQKEAQLSFFLHKFVQNEVIFISQQQIQLHIQECIVEISSLIFAPWLCFKETTSWNTAHMKNNRDRNYLGYTWQMMSNMAAEVMLFVA